MSSAAMVSRRIRDSAKATSSAIDGDRWWHTISMSRCSSTVFTVYGRVGLVDDGSTLGKPQAPDDVGRVAATGTLGVVGVDGAAGHCRQRILDETGFVQRVGVDGHLDIEVLCDRQAVVDRRRRGAPVLVQFQPDRAGGDLFGQGPGREALPLPRNPRLTGNASAACSMRWMFHGPGVHVVALVPVAGPVPPPSMVVMPDINASSICCGQMKWI